MSRKVKRYTNEFKLEAVNLALKSPSISEVAKELGVPIATLHGWINALKEKPPSSQQKSTGTQMAALIEENRRLQKELARTKEEREILKKAAAYFAQHQK